MKTPHILTAGIAALIMAPLTASADNRNWIGGGVPADWNDPLNWDTGVPTTDTGDNIFMHTADSILGVAINAGSMRIGVGTPGVPASGFTFGAGSYNLGYLGVGEAHDGLNPTTNRFGRAFINAGTTINVGQFFLGEWDGGTGQVLQSGGDVTVTNQFRVGHWPQADVGAGTASIYTMTGGTLTVTGDPSNPTDEGQAGNVFLGIDSTGILRVNGGTFTAKGVALDNRGATGGEDTLEINGGIVNIGANGIVSQNAGNPGTYNVNLGGGTLRATANWSSNLETTLLSGGSGIQIDTNTRTVTLSGSVVGPGGLTKVGTGTLKLSGNNSFAGGTTVNAGTLQIGDGGAGGTLGSGPVVVNSPGSLTYSRSDAQTFANVFTGNGALTIASGTLRLSNPSSAMNPSVNPSATFGTSGTVGTVFASAGSTLEAGIDGVGNFTAGSAFLFGNTLKVSAGTANTKFLITAPNGLTASGPSVIQVNPVNLTTGVYPLIDYNGTIGGGGFANFSVTGLPSRAVGGLVDNVGNTSIDLNITAIDFPIWTGSVDGLWDTTTQNWKLGIGSGPTNYQNLDAVVFDNTALGNTTVNLTAAFTPSSVLFNNSTVPYTLTGVGSLGGTTSLTKQGSDRVTIANTGTNAFTGATLVQAGTLQIGDGVAGSLGVDTVITIGTAGTVELDLPAAANFNTPTQGTGVLRPIGFNSFNIAANVLSGSPTLDLPTVGQIISVNNQPSYSGIVAITGGTLRALGGQALGNDTGITTIGSGGTLDVNGMDLGAEQVFVSGDGSGGGAIINNGAGTIFNLRKITLTGDASFGGTGRWDIRTGAVPGELLDLAGFKLRKVGSNQVSLVNVNATPGDIDIDGGIFSIEDLAQVQGAGTITVNAGGTLGLWVNKPGTLTRNIVAAGGGITELGSGEPTMVNSPISMEADLTFTVNGGNTVLTQSGNITESGGARILNVNGAGRLILLGTNTWTGGYNVNGTLQIGNGNALGNLGTGPGTVNGNLAFARIDSTTITDSINSGGPSGSILFLGGGTVSLAAGVDVKVANMYFGVNGVNDTVGGTLVIGTGNSLTISNSFQIGDSSGGGSLTQGTVNQTGGTVDVNVPGTDGREFVLGHWGQTQGIYNLSNGTLNAPNISMAVSWDGAGTFNQSGGTANLKGLRFGHNGGQSGIYELTAGDLNLGSDGIWSENAGLPNDINLGGGIVRAMVTAPITEPVELTGTNGNVTFDTNGNTLTVTGMVSGVGGFTKIGAGTLVLGSPNSYTGATTVSAGTLAVISEAALGTTSGVDLSNGATLQADGNVTSNHAFTLGAGGGQIDTGANTVILDATSTITGTSLTKLGTGILTLDGTQTYATLTTSAGTTNLDSPLGTGTSTLNANANTNISVNQTLAALNIGAGATVVLDASPSPGEGFALGAAEVAGTAAVPEPGTAALLLVGALGMLARRRRA